VRARAKEAPEELAHMNRFGACGRDQEKWLAAEIAGADRPMSPIIN
jgi:hypothetical protein